MQSPNFFFHNLSLSLCFLKKYLKDITQKGKTPKYRFIEKDKQYDRKRKLPQNLKTFNSHACLVWASLTNDSSLNERRFRASFNSVANDATFRLKLCFFSFKSFSNGSTSRAGLEDGKEENFSETDIGRTRFGSSSTKELASQDIFIQVHPKIFAVSKRDPQ